MSLKNQIQSWMPEESIKWNGEVVEINFSLDQLETNLLFAIEHLKFYWLKDICVEDDIDHSKFIIRYFLQNPDQSIILIIKCTFEREQVIQSVAPIWKNASVFESEAYEMFGVNFDYDPKKKFFDQEVTEYPLRKNFTKFNNYTSKQSINSENDFKMGIDFPMNSNDVFFSLELDNDSISKCELDLGYHHMGLEKSLENLNTDQVLHKINLASDSSAIHWNMAWAMLVEQCNDIEIPDKAKGIRMILSELVRVKDHLKVLFQLAYKTEYVSFFNTMLFWHNRTIDQINSFSQRKNVHDSFVIGGVRDDLPAGWMASCLDFLSNLEKHLLSEYKFFYNNSFWFERLQCGQVSREVAMDNAICGPTLRATGVNHDHRKRAPFYFYEEVSFEVPLGVNGYVYDRFLIYVEEIFQSIKIVTQVLDNIPAGRTISSEVLYFDNYKDLSGVTDDVLYRRSVENIKKLKSDSNYFSLESSNGLIDIWAKFSNDSLTQRVKCSTTSSKLLHAFENKIVGEKLEDLEVFWISLGIKMSEVER